MLLAITKEKVHVQEPEPSFFKFLFIRRNMFEYYFTSASDWHHMGAVRVGALVPLFVLYRVV